MGSMITDNGGLHMYPTGTRDSRMVSPNSGHSQAFRVVGYPTVSFCYASHISTISAPGVTGITVKPISTIRPSI